MKRKNEKAKRHASRMRAERRIRSDLLGEGNWAHEFIPSPRDLGRAWQRLDTSTGSARLVYKPDNLVVIISGAIEEDGKRWIHLSVSTSALSGHLPSWEQLKMVKGLFLGDRKAIQVLPPESEYVNLHPTCLHLWCCLDGDPLPDFTRGSGQI